MRRPISLSLFLITSLLALALAGRPALAAPEPSHADAGHADPAHADAGHADPAHADAGHGGGHHEPHGVVPSLKQAIAPALTALVVFGLVCFIGVVAVWPKISGGLNDRANKIRSEIAAAEAARASAKSALEEYEKSLSQARAEAQRMLDDTKTKQAELAAELRAKNDRDLSQLRDKAMRDIEAARKAALAEIYAESVSLATAIASKILQREVTPRDQDRLVEESLSELGRRN